MQNNPEQIDIKAGMRKPIALNSRYIKSTIIGTKHNTPIPIIIIPEFLAIINTSFLLMYLISNLPLIKSVINHISI